MTIRAANAASPTRLARSRRGLARHGARSYAVALGLLGALIALLPSTARAIVPIQTTTYNVQVSDAYELVTGSITTDGASGSLAMSDILSWSFDVSGATGSFNINSSSGGGGCTGCLIAFGGGLFVDTVSGYDSFGFSGPGGGIGINYPDGPSGSYSFIPETNSGSLYAFFLPVTTPIASVPEPSDRALLLTGLGLVGLIMRRQRVDSTKHP